jgi:hypothetical protein
LFLEIVIFGGSKKKQRSCDGQGGAQRPVCRGNKLKKTGACSARARTRGQNPLVMLYLGPVNSVKKSAKSKNTVGGKGDGVLFVLRIFLYI